LRSVIVLDCAGYLRSSRFREQRNQGRLRHESSSANRCHTSHSTLSPLLSINTAVTFAVTPDPMARVWPRGVTPDLLNESEANTEKPRSVIVLDCAGYLESSLFREQHNRGQLRYESSSATRCHTCHSSTSGLFSITKAVTPIVTPD